MVWGTPGFTARLEGASGRSWALCFERRLAPRPGHAENPASSVWLVRDGNSGNFYAAKRQNVTLSQTNALVDEASAWRAASLRSPVLAELVDVFVIREEPCSVTFLHEFCARGHIPKRAPSEPVLLTLIADLAEAADVVLTATSAPHTNISYSSVLVDQDGRLRLAGFGAQRSAKLAAGASTPEDDVFDIGRVVYEVVMGRPMREPSIPDGSAPYSENVTGLLRDLLDAPESRMLPAEAAARAQSLGAKPRAPIVDVSESGASRTAEHTAVTDEPAAPDIERAVEKLTTGIDVGSAYPAVLEALERDPPAASRSLFRSLFNCPIASDPLCTIRSLTMLHNIMLDGPAAVLDAARGNDKFLDWVESTWTQEAIAAAAAVDDPGAEPPHPASRCFAGGDLAFYTSLLRRKARFHMLAAGGFSGGWDRTNVTAADGRDVLVTRRRKVVGGMADLAEMASEIGVRFATATDAESSLKHASLRAIVDECGRAFNAALGLAGETQSVRDAEKLVPSIARLWEAGRALLHAVRDIRSAGADAWAEQFPADSPPDIVQEAEFRIRGGGPVEIADDMPKSGWEEAKIMLSNVDGDEVDSKEKKKEKKRKKKENSEDATASAPPEEEEKPGDISAGDGALVLHGAGDAAAAAVTTLFGDLLKLDGGDTSHLRDVPADALNARVPGELTDGEALASAFGAPPPTTPALGYDDDDDDGGYDNFRARQQEARVSASTGAWAARAGYGGGALVVHHSAEVAPNKPHPAFCQCALCAQAEAQNAALQADGRARDGYSDEGYGAYGQHGVQTSRPDAYGNGYDSPGGRNRNGNSNGAQDYYKNHDDAGSYESISYSVDEDREYQPRERKTANRTTDYDSSPPSRHSGSTVPLGQPSITLSTPVRDAGPSALRTEFVVNLKKLRTGDKLGEGAFGVVYKGEYKRETVAIKKMNKKMLGSKNAMAEFSNEVHIMCSLSHPGVLKCIAASLTAPNVLLVTEFMKRGTLFDVLYKQHIKLTWSMIRKIALQLAEGLAHLQERDIVHRDVKASNVLVDGSYNAKLGDFGLAGPPRPPSAAGVSGTYQYMAPEILSGAPHSSKSDVYAYGLVLLEMISGSPPFFGLDPMEAAQQVMNQNARPPIPSHCQRAYANIIQLCWGAAPASRPDFENIVNMIKTTTK